MEYVDDENKLAQKYRKLFKLIDNAKYIVFFTGAGISTAAQIPDFRGEHGLNKNPLNIAKMGISERDLDCKMPTYAHCAISHLILNFDKFKFITTSNHDGLHQKSGTPWEATANIFGTAYIEECLTCHKQHIRKVIVPALHRNCKAPNCGGKLKKTGVRYGQKVPIEPLKMAEESADKSDLVLVLGSSMTTSPFCQLPHLAKNFVICNRQATPYDKDATICIHDNVDNFMERVVKHFDSKKEITFNYEQDFSIFEREDKVVLTTPRPDEPAVFVDEAYLMSRSGSGHHTFEHLLNGEFVLDRFLLEEHVEYIVNVEFKPAFEVPASEVTFVLGSVTKGKLEKRVHFK